MTALRPATFEACPAQEGQQPAAAGAEADPRARPAAQRGLDFLARDTIEWQGRHNCYGCHVQAVTLEAMVVGRVHDYRVTEPDMAAVLRGMLDISGGARGPNGFSVGGSPGHLIESAQAFGGAALAQYDQHLGAQLADELLTTAHNLLAYQNEDGSVRSTDRRPPVVAGLMQSTTQAAQTWRQAYARSADEQWLPPIARAEGYLRTRAQQLTDDTPERILELNYAVMGLVAAGAQRDEAVVTHLERQLREAQGADGGWALNVGAGSGAFATGQALYALKLIGTSDSDRVVRRGMAWLIEHQQANGGWSSGGARRGEAMWAVLGLVSTDVLSITVTGLVDGQRLRGHSTIAATASDNSGDVVRHVDLFVDEVPVHRACGGEFEHELPVLETGVHQVDLVATNRAGRTTRRRIEVYAGDYFLTRVGTRFNAGSTIVSLRNVAPEGTRGSVRLRVFRQVERDGQPARGEEVLSTEQASAEGAMRFSWNGQRSDGNSAPRGRYLAELSFVRPDGRVLQTAEVPFVHDTAEVQRASFGDVQGQLRVGGEGASAGVQVELLDERGNVVQSVQTTRSGNYRFRNLDRGNYRVRVRRRGFRAEEAAVTATPASEDAPAAASRADFEMQLLH